MVLGNSGFLFGSWAALLPNEHDVTADLIWTDAKLEGETTILSDIESGINAGAAVAIGGSGTPVANYAPISSRPIMIEGNNKAFLFLNKPEIAVFDFESKTITNRIAISDKKIPFNQEWGQTQMDTQLEFIKKNPQMANVEFKPNFPEFYPLVRSLALDPDGNLIVLYWRANPDDDSTYETYNVKGEKLANSYEWRDLSRYVGSHGEWAFITTFDEEEEQAGVARVKIKDIKDFLAANPINFEGNNQRTIMLEN